jgi:hypothetical protein
VVVLVDLFTMRVLKMVVPLPEIEVEPAPVKFIVLVDGVKVPSFTKFPERSCVDEPASNVQLLPMLKFPPTARLAAAVADGVPDIVKLPFTVVAEPGIVFVPLPLKVRLW